MSEAQTDGQTALIARCNTFIEQTKAGIDWVKLEENAETVGVQRESIERNFRRSIRRAGKLRDAAGTNMAVSVFGPSQNGKSFLVSVLARPENKPLISAFNDPDGALSYIRDINPAGEGESTGLVTRFTMERGQTPAGYPIMLQMLTVSDMVQTIGNTFFMDGDQSEQSPEVSDIAAHVGKFADRAKAGGLTNNGLTEDDVWEIADYVERNFKSYAYANALAPFWPEAAKIAPALPLADLGSFFAIVWGNHKEFTQVFQRLVEGLSKIGFATTAYAPMAALVPRQSSIIDVAQLYLLDKDDTSMLELSLPDGQTMSLQRSVVSALTAEFVLPMQDLPDPMFQQTDLLDFPGARNRFSDPLERTFVDPEGGIGRLLLRGKVAYLFDRYVEDQKINAMLLCIRDSNMDTIDLPRLIENWIGLTQGQPRRCASRPPASCFLS
uniref:Virulence factor SrfC family protein n=1 Tax=Yoonia rhodophyticola TaxID=3137370 RepID=A0AAN0MCQ3_9RHOB